MFKTFLIAYRLKDTYCVNTIIYGLKSIPLLKKLLPNALYKHHGLKVFCHILSVLWELISLFLGKIIYFSLMFMLPFAWMNRVDFHSFIQLLLFLTVIGSIFNSGMFAPTRDKYYAVILMKMNGREIVLSEYIYTMIGHLIGFIPCFLFLRTPMHYSLLWCLILPLFICSFKMMMASYFLYDYQVHHHIHSEYNNTPITISLSLICLLLGYGLLFFNVMIPLDILISLFSIVIVVGIGCLYYILNYSCYHGFSHDLLKNYENTLQIDTHSIINKTYREMISVDTNMTSQKTGFEYFHELFVKRHKKILWRLAKRQTYIIAVIIGCMMILIATYADIRMIADDLLNIFLSYVVFIMYSLNTTKNVTRAMFINCDHSMLTYSFYRIPQNILELFKMRLREMIKINVLPGFVLAIGYLMISIECGGMSRLLNGVIGFVSILAMSIFFSTHYLILYYLLQPYNMKTEVKNPVYTIIVSLTYLICYGLIQIQIDTLSFGIACILFCICYCVISCILVYKRADQTFKIRQ